MQLAFNTDEQALFDAFEQFFSRESPPAVARAAEPLGFDRNLWVALDAMEVWGSGAALGDLAVIAEVAGRWIAPVPFVEHAVATRALGVSPAGLATVALRPPVDGVWRLVPAGAVADVVVGPTGGGLVAVASAPPMSGPRNHACAPLADRFVQSPSPVAADGERVLAEWKLLTAASLVGIASRSLELAVEYVGERRQFGVPIGSFQAVQHGLAELPGIVDGARLLVHQAAAALDRGGAGRCDPALNDIEDGGVLASMAFIFAAGVATKATDRALHYHGGYGFAEEHDIQLYYRRARGWALLLGDPADECVALADQLWPAAGGC